MQNRVTQAFILGAGRGTRLAPLTDTVPKVMVPITSRKPLLEHTIERLAKQGIRDIVINVHHLPKAIMSYFGDGAKWGVRIAYSDETKQLMETGGAIKKAENLLHDDFLLIYGDTLHFFDFTPLIDFYIEHDALGAVVLKRSHVPQDGDLGEFDPVTKRIVKWHVRPHDVIGPIAAPSVAAGLYVLSKKIVKYIPAGVLIKLDHEVIPKVLMVGETLYAFPTEEPIFDIGRPEKYEVAKRYYERRIAELKRPQA